MCAKRGKKGWKSGICRNMENLTPRYIKIYFLIHIYQDTILSFHFVLFHSEFRRSNHVTKVEEHKEIKIKHSRMFTIQIL